MAQQCCQMHQVCRPQAAQWLLMELQSCQTVPRCCQWVLLFLMARQLDSLLGRLWRLPVLLCCQQELQATWLAMQCRMALTWVLLMEQRCWQLVLPEFHWVEEHLCPRVQMCCQLVLQGCQWDLLSRLRVPQWIRQAH